MRLVVWGQSKETDLIMVLWVTAFLPYGGETEQTQAHLQGRAPGAPCAFWLSSTLTTRKNRTRCLCLLLPP